MKARAAGGQNRLAPGIHTILPPVAAACRSAAPALFELSPGPEAPAHRSGGAGVAA